MNKTNLQPGNGYQLPPDAYYSEEWLEKENCHLFARTWNYACTTDDLPSAGSYVTVQVGHYSIALVRGDDNVIRGFHNVCRHRGAKILDDNGTCTKLRCPYHAWVYDLEGSLKSVPQGKQQIPLLDKTEWNLLSINVGIWMGMVFVNPDGKAEPFETFRGEISGVLDCFRLDELTELTKVEYIFDANWKFYIENHIDWYHLWYTHEHTLGALDHSAGYTKQINPHWVSFEPYKDKDTQTPPFKPIGGLTEEAKLNGAHLVFPNLTLFSGESWFGTGHITPVGPEKAKMSFRLRALPGQDPSRFMAGFHQVTQVEDAMVASRMQANIKSSAFSVGPMAKDYEASIAAFHDNYLEILSK